jgi:hypothetical protein
MTACPASVNYAEPNMPVPRPSKVACWIRPRTTKFTLRWLFMDLRRLRAWDVSFGFIKGSIANGFTAEQRDEDAAEAFRELEEMMPSVQPSSLPS